MELFGFENPSIALPGERFGLFEMTVEQAQGRMEQLVKSDPEANDVYSKARDAAGKDGLKLLEEIQERAEGNADKEVQELAELARLLQGAAQEQGKDDAAERARAAFTSVVETYLDYRLKDIDALAHDLIQKDGKELKTAYEGPTRDLPLTFPGIETTDKGKGLRDFIKAILYSYPKGKEDYSKNGATIWVEEVALAFQRAIAADANHDGRLTLTEFHSITGKDDKETAKIRKAVLATAVLANKLQKVHEEMTKDKPDEKKADAPPATPPPPANGGEIVTKVLLAGAVGFAVGYLLLRGKAKAAKLMADKIIKDGGILPGEIARAGGRFSGAATFEQVAAEVVPAQTGMLRNILGGLIGFGGPIASLTGAKPMVHHLTEDTMLESPTTDNMVGGAVDLIVARQLAKGLEGVGAAIEANVSALPPVPPTAGRVAGALGRARRAANGAALSAGTRFPRVSGVVGGLVLFEGTDAFLGDVIELTQAAGFGIKDLNEFDMLNQFLGDPTAVARNVGSFLIVKSALKAAATHPAVRAAMIGFAGGYWSGGKLFNVLYSDPHAVKFFDEFYLGWLEIEPRFKLKKFEKSADEEAFNSNLKIIEGLKSKGLPTYIKALEDWTVRDDSRREPDASTNKLKDGIGVLPDPLRKRLDAALEKAKGEYTASLPPVESAKPEAAAPATPAAKTARPAGRRPPAAKPAPASTAAGFDPFAPAAPVEPKR